ncbi:histidine kinase [Eubacterium sp. CAG:603]|jgi:signal transduction histidine kinase|nr:histidine kinase [Eubacterium sp. CAG:603]
MESILAFIKGEKSKNEKSINEITEKINQNLYQIEEIENMVVELSKNIDTTYEIFSPNDFDKDNNVVEIEKLNLKKTELNIEIEALRDKLDNLEKQKSKIDASLEEIYDIEKQLANNVKNTKYLIDKEVKKTEEKNIKKSTLILEQQINKDNHYISNIVKKDIEKVHNKIELCENLIDMDSNRAKLEITKIKEELLYIEKKVNAKMFHVKHSEEDSEKIGLYKNISDFIKEYQKKINMKISFNYSGLKILDSKWNVINVIRIIKEAIDNAESHSNGTIININIVIDKINVEENDYNIDDISTDSNQVESEINNGDLHQINFLVGDENRYNINIVITDNGDGFTMQDDNVLLSNNLNGISIMKYRTSLLNGMIIVDSSLGMGTTVKLVYQVS